MTYEELAKELWNRIVKQRLSIGTFFIRMEDDILIMTNSESSIKTCAASFYALLFPSKEYPVDWRRD